MTISENMRITSMVYARDAERWRTREPSWARYLLWRHIETREQARRLGKQEKKP